MPTSDSRGPGNLVRQVTRATRADAGVAVASAAVVAAAATVIASRVKDGHEPALEANGAPERDATIAPEPVTPVADAATIKRRPTPSGGRRILHPHVPKRRGTPRRGLIPMLLLMAVGFTLAVPWYLPGFTGYVHGFTDSVNQAGDSIGHLFDKPTPVVVKDPAILASEPPVPVKTDSRSRTVPGIPKSLQVPRLQVDSRVIPISGNSGELLPPDNPQEIGWWMQGPKPGSAEGTAVLTGHTVHYGGGAFDHLSFLKVGDHFTVKTDHGSIRYVITHLHKYETGTLADVASRLFLLTGPPRVLLVTCSGWNGHIYLENTVVTGVPA